VPSDKSLLAELLELSPAERIQLAENLWDSVAASPETMPSPTAAQVAEIERRLAEHARNPSRAIPWDEVRARLWSRFE
jgi:putative addiction module component (TIGR02574 family)